MNDLSNLSRLNGFIFAHINICSIRNKCDEVQRILHLSKIDVLGISETNLNDSIESAELAIDGYNLIRLDRQDFSRRSSGGGVCVYIRDDILYEFDQDLSVSNVDLELLCLRLKLKNTRPVLIFNAYRPPHGNSGSACRVLDQTYNLRNPELHILGDLNINLLNTTCTEVSLHVS